MALMQCPDCGGAVSSAAAACPACGYPVNQPDPLTAAVAASRSSLGPRRRPFRLSRLWWLVVIAAATLGLLVFRKWADEHPEQAAPYQSLLVALAYVGAWGIPLAVVIWVIRQGVRHGMDDHQRGR